ncbi:hypothetical protein DICSQDRAFT_173537 [Dichomitus squalens LYAD-421 SS1]|uniref:Uncharacterized protein n=1 Tax=Dichomitus squalens (strain LYAD-421) TaxID=732165 RepID=R7SQ84_DICSQ|nr:uncharacterized protein DICSQDRAFT_173537 [Dichomitus squalens LYAD-421 SS1]EJF57915.1 hypothetical protein DICSQDRAFT_173537 [Dichomitus squalens LYAD-421 SS1]
MHHDLDSLEHLVIPRLTGTSLYHAPNLWHLDFWSTSLEPGLTCQDAHNTRATVPALRTVRFIFTLITRTLHGAYMVAHSNWLRICHPDLLRDQYR